LIQARFAEHRRHVLKLYMTVSVQVCEESSTFARGFSEVHRKDPAAWPQNPPDFANTRLTRFDRQVVKHQGAQDSVEMCIGKRQCFGNSILENDLNSSSLCLPVSSTDHFRRCINSSHLAGWTHAQFGNNR
jgi:hypothetical protein